MSTLMHIQRRIEALQEADMDERQAIKDELTRLGADAVESLIEAVRSAPAKTAYIALQILAQINDPRVVEPIIEACQASNVMVRQTAVKALSDAGDPRAFDALLAAMQDVSALVQLQAVEGLARIGDHRAVDPLCELLPHAESTTLQHTIIRALGQLGDPRALPVILACEGDHHVRDRKRVAVVHLLYQALGADGPPHATLQGTRVVIGADEVSPWVDLIMALRDHGATVTVEWWSAGDAERLLHAVQFDLLLLDVVLSEERSGYDAVDEVHAVPALAAIPMVAISAADPAENVRLARAHGLAGFIRRSEPVATVPALLAAVLRGESVWPEV